MSYATTVESRRRADRAHQMAAVLRRQVLDHWQPGRSLPSEEQLAIEFGATRNAVRDALDLLRREGLVERRQGIGTLVAARKHPHGLDRLQGLAETFNGVGTVRNEVRIVTLLPAPREVARRLELSESAEVVYIERLRTLDDEPISLDLTYLVPDLGLPLIERDLQHNDIFALLEEVADCGLDSAELVLEATSADAHLATVLDTHHRAPLLSLERLASLRNGRPVDLEYVRFRGDRVSLHGTTRRTDKESR